MPSKNLTLNNRRAQYSVEPIPNPAGWPTPRESSTVRGDLGWYLLQEVSAGIFVVVSGPYRTRKEARSSHPAGRTTHTARPDRKSNDTPFDQDDFLRRLREI